MPPTPGLTRNGVPRRTGVAGVIAVASYVALLLLFGPLIFRGLVNNQLPAALAALAVLAATPMICVIVMSDAPTEPTRRLVLTRRDLAPARADLRRGDDFSARR